MLSATREKYSRAFLMAALTQFVINRSVSNRECFKLRWLRINVLAVPGKVPRLNKSLSCHNFRVTRGSRKKKKILWFQMCPKTSVQIIFFFPSYCKRFPWNWKVCLLVFEGERKMREKEMKKIRYFCGRTHSQRRKEKKKKKTFLY